MFVLSLVMKALDKVEETKDKAIDDLIARTKAYGAPNGNAGEVGWLAVYESIKQEQQNERKAQKGH
jgi:hypothetical protein